MTASLETLGRGDGPYSARQLKQIQDWIKEDWESSDCSADLVNVVWRLLKTITNLRHGILAVIRYAAKQRCHRRNCGTVCMCEPCQARKIIAILDPTWNP